MTENPFRYGKSANLCSAAIKPRLKFLLSWIPELQEYGQILDIGEVNTLRKILQTQAIAKIVNTTGDLNWAMWEPMNQYPVVLCLEVLEHLQNPLNFLYQVRYRMRPGSILYLTTPKESLKLLRMSDHFFELDEYRLRSLFDLCGIFRVIEIQETKSNYPRSIFWRGLRPLLRALIQKSWAVKAVAI